MSRKLELRSKSTTRDYYGYISTEKPSKKLHINDAHGTSTNLSLDSNVSGHCLQHKCDKRRLWSITARGDELSILPSLRQPSMDSNFVGYAGEYWEQRLRNNSETKKAYFTDTSVFNPSKFSKTKFLTACNTSNSFHTQNTNFSRTSSVGRQPRRNSIQDGSCILPSSDTTLPAINEYRTASTLKAKQSMYKSHIESKKNESLLRSMKYLQESQDYENKVKWSPNKTSVKFWPQEKLVTNRGPRVQLQQFSKSVNLGKALKPAKYSHRVTSVCRYTEDKYIKDVYIKNKVPDIDNKKKVKKGIKFRKLNKSQIKMKNKKNKRINMAGEVNRSHIDPASIISELQECL